MLQLNPPIPLQTPKGKGLAWILIDYGPEHDLIWVVADDATGEVWAWSNKEVRAPKNITMGRPPIQPPPTSIPVPTQVPWVPTYGSDDSVA